MIRIARGDEPEELRAERRLRRAQCRLIDLGHREGPMDLKVGYQCAAEALRHPSSQGPFCAYCEGQIRESGEPVDHFRPKSAVYDHSKRPVASGYWWLTWSWENLLRACGTCNDQQHKGNRFPLLHEAARLTVLASPPQDEVALLLDPTREDPMDFIEFRIQGRDVDGAAQWKPFPRRGLTAFQARRAATTIEVLGLDRGDILGFYTAHVGALSLGVAAVKEAIARDDRDAVATSWRALLGAAFGCYVQYKALAWDYLRHTLDDATRERWNLDLPRPGSMLGAHASEDVSRPPMLDELLWLEIEALGRSSPDVAHIRTLLLRVVSATPSSTEALAGWFCREVRTVEEHLKALEADAAVARDDTRWRRP